MYKELNNLPIITIGIPVGPNLADSILEMLDNQVGEINVYLDNLRKEGATLTISTHTKPYPDWDEEEEEDEGLKKYLEYEDDGWGDIPDIDFDIDPFD